MGCRGRTAGPSVAVPSSGLKRAPWQAQCRFWCSLSNPTVHPRWVHRAEKARREPSLRLSTMTGWPWRATVRAWLGGSSRSRQTTEEPLIESESWVTVGVMNCARGMVRDAAEAPTAAREQEANQSRRESRGVPARRVMDGINDFGRHASTQNAVSGVASRLHFFLASGKAFQMRRVKNMPIRVKGMRKMGQAPQPRLGMM